MPLYLLYCISHRTLRVASLFGARLCTRSKAIVPYLGLYLTDLTFIEDGNSDLVQGDDGNPCINLAKCQMVGKALLEVLPRRHSTFDRPGPLTLY